MLGSGGGIASPNRLMSAFEYGRAPKRTSSRQPTTTGLPCRSCSVTSGRASAIMTVSSMVAIARPYRRVR